jgi:hypothetical protein
VYKVVIDIMERYYSEFDGPLFNNYRKRLIPFATKFYRELTQSDIKYLKTNLKELKPYYGSKQNKVMNNLQFRVINILEEKRIHQLLPLEEH